MKTRREFFFFFILGSGSHGASHRISGDPVLGRMRVVRLLLQAVTSECLRKRGEKRERARERGREGGREGVNEGGRGRLLLPFKKKKTEKLLWALSQEGFGSGGDAGESCLTPAPRASLTQPWTAQPCPHSTGAIQRQISPQACTKLCSHTPRACAPLTPTSSTLVCYGLFHQKKKNTPVLSQMIFGFVSELPEG